MTGRPEYVVTLRHLDADTEAANMARLRRALKCLKRVFRLEVRRILPAENVTVTTKQKPP